MIWALRGVVALAVVLAWRVSRHHPPHRPIALGLGLSLALDVLRAVAPQPRELALALYCAPAALSVWVAWRVFQHPLLRPQKGKCPRIRRIFPWSRWPFALAAVSWTFAFEIVLFLGGFPWSYRILPWAALAVSVVAQALLAGLWFLRWRPSRPPPRSPYRTAPAAPARPLEVSQSCAIVLLLGDVLGLLGPAGPLPWDDHVDRRAAWWIVGGQAALVAGILVWIQGVWLRWQRCDMGR